MAQGTTTAVLDALARCRDKPYEEARSMPRAFYTDAAVLALERERLFSREWVCVGRAEELEGPGDFLTFRIGDEPVLVVRGEDGAIRALSNVCRHRGALLAEARGRARRFICPYHHWTYDTEGRLVSAPRIPERADFDPAACRLPAFACTIWHGFIFVCLNPATEALEPRLKALDERIDPYHLGEMRLRYLADEVWEINWKCLLENFMEGYHLSPLHRETLHAVNPTRLCRHFPPGEAFFGYLAGFSPDLPRSQKGHPALSEAEVDTCVMFAVPPGLVVGCAGDYSSFLCIQPEAVERTRVKLGLIFFGPDWPEDRVEWAVDLFRKTMAEDKTVLLKLAAGLRSRHHEQGPLAPADFEGPIWDFYKYMGRALTGEPAKPAAE